MRDRWRTARAVALVAVPLVVVAPLSGGFELGDPAAAQLASETFDLNLTVNVVPGTVAHSVTVTNLDDVNLTGSYGDGDTIVLHDVPVGSYKVVVEASGAPVSMAVTCDNVSVFDDEEALSYVIDASSPAPTENCSLRLESDPAFDVPDGLFTLTETVVAPGSAAANDRFEVTGPNGATSLLGNGDSITAALGAGSYTVAETVPAGWVVSLSCTITDLAGGSRTVAGSASASFTISGGAAVSCSLITTKLATVTIVNSSTPDESTSFPFDGPGGGFTVVDDGSQTFDGLNPGSIVVTRKPVTDWPLESIGCVDENGGATSAISVDSPSVTIDVIAGDAITCTFPTIKTEIIDPAVKVATTTTRPATIETDIIDAAVEVATSTTRPAPATSTSTTTTTSTTTVPPGEPVTVVEGAVLLSLGPTIQLGGLVVDVGDLCQRQGDPDPSLWVDDEEVPSSLGGHELRMDGGPTIVGETDVAVRCGQGPIVAEGTVLLGAATGGAGGSSATVVVVVLFFLALSGAAVVPGLLGGTAAPTVAVKE